MSTNPQPAQPATEFASGARVQSALSPQATFLVQIASVSHVEDASVLVNALRKRGYTVTAQRKPEDGLIHVWIGPFSSRDEAHRWKLKLLDDGYNAIVQP
jgi:cell division septation protein DedD